MNLEARSTTSLLRVALIALVLIAVALLFTSRVRSQDEDVGTTAPTATGETAALGNAFNYSGQLDSGTANGAYDFQFKLFDAGTGGTQIGATLDRNDIQVTRGLFSTPLDFGAMFNSDPRFLEIALRPGAQTGAYTVLAPRRPVSPVPLAMFSDNTRGLSVTEAGALSVDGSITAWHPSGDGRAISMHQGDDYARLRIGGPGADVFELQGPGDLTYMRSGAGGTYHYGAWALYPRSEENAAVSFFFNEAGTQLRLGGTGPLISGLEIQRQGVRLARFDSSGLTVDNALTIRGGADLSERFEVSNGIAVEPGTVMVIDPDNPGHLTPSTSAYDLKVAGVVSGAGNVDAGLVLSQEGVMEGDAVVAIAGRVYVRAEAISGPITPGDLLTSSNMPGYAMAANDFDRAHGAVIGKAMTELERGTGLVLVLINLQ